MSLPADYEDLVCAAHWSFIRVTMRTPKRIILPISWASDPHSAQRMESVLHKRFGFEDVTYGTCEEPICCVELERLHRSLALRPRPQVLDSEDESHG